MYIEHLTLLNVRTFVKSRIFFANAGRRYTKGKQKPTQRLFPRPAIPNVTLLLGDNGSGKSTVLRSIAQSALGPAFASAGLRDNGLVRRSGVSKAAKGVDRSKPTATVAAQFRLHEQDRAPGRVVDSRSDVQPRGDLEMAVFHDTSGGLWEPIYESKNDTFFVVGYGATRRVERPDKFDMGARTSARFLRAQRVASLFEDSFSLIPLTYWLPELKTANPGRYTQVVHLINRLLGPGHYTFTERLEGGDYLFERGGLQVPFQAMSDGHRAFVGWVADLLYHVCYGCPSGEKLVDNAGIVLVDEIDLHLHPTWQMRAIPTIAAALPNMQFVFTSHSPLVAGSLEWMNIVALKTNDKTNRTVARRLLRENIHGLDADQILLTDFFGMQTTMAPEKQKQLDALSDRVQAGDRDAPLRLIQQLAQGLEAAK
jgi:hypothetical protein